SRVAWGGGHLPTLPKTAREGRHTREKLMASVYKFGCVRVYHHKVDWPNAHPDFSDFARATPDRYKQGPGRHVHYYGNPSRSVIAPASCPVEVFLQHARQAQNAWRRQIDDSLTRPVRRRLEKHLSWGERLLVTSGVLVIGGRPAHPSRISTK